MRRLLIIVVLLVLAGGSLYMGIAGSSRPSYEPVKQVELGDLAPNFQLEDTRGNKVSLADLRGKVVLINFWATWCPPCKAEMPAFEQTYKDYTDEGFVILAVNAIQQDSVEAIDSFRAANGLTFPILLDTNGDINRAYQVRSLPTSFFVGKDGIISEVVIGGPMAEALIRSRIEELINQ